MHILEIPSFFPPHGGLFCLEQARALKARGHEVRILSCTQLGYSVDGNFFFSASTAREWAVMEGIEVYQTYMRGLPKLLHYNVSRWLAVVEDMFQEYVKCYGTPDIIHAHCCNLAGVVAMRLSKKHEIPYFITEHLSSLLYKKDFGEGWTRNLWLRQLLTSALESAACVIPVSQELMDDIAPFFGKKYNYHVLSNIVDTDFFSYKEREPRHGRPFRYCCLAIANVKEKGYDVLAEAWKGIENAELHIAGIGTDTKEFSAMFSGDVTICGHLDKESVRELLYKCDALVLPSRGESQGLVLLEAMSTGIPVVTTDVVPQSVRIKEACIIVPSGDAIALKNAMKRVKLVHPSSVFSAEVESLASPKVVAEQLEKIFLWKS